MSWLEDIDTNQDVPKSNDFLSNIQTPEVVTTGDVAMNAAKALGRNLFVPFEGAKTAIDLGKAGVNFVGGAASYIPSWLAGLGYTGAQTLGNALIKSNTPGSEGFNVKTPQEITEGADFVRENFGKIVPQFELKTPEGKAASHIIEKGFEKFNILADALPYLVGVSKEEYPRAHFGLQFLSELAMFKGVHSAGNKAAGGIKRLANKFDKKTGKYNGDIVGDIEAELKKTAEKGGVEPPTIEDLATPQSRQAYIRRVIPETAEARQDTINTIMGEDKVQTLDIAGNEARKKQRQKYYPDTRYTENPTTFDLRNPRERQTVIDREFPRTPEDNQEVINAAMRDRIQDIPEKRDIPIAEGPRSTVSGEKSVPQTNLEAKDNLQAKIEMMKKIKPQDSISALENVNRIREDLGLKPYEIPKKEKPAEPETPLIQKSNEGINAKDLGDIVHGTDSATKLRSIIDNGLNPNSHVGAQAQGYPIQLVYDKGSLGEQGVAHRPGDSMTTKRGAKPKKIIVDQSDFYDLREEAVILKDLEKELKRLEDNGIKPEDIYEDKNRKSTYKARSLNDELSERMDAESSGRSATPMKDMIDEATKIGKELNIPVELVELIEEGPNLRQQKIKDLYKPYKMISEDPTIPDLKDPSIKRDLDIDRSEPFPNKGGMEVPRYIEDIKPKQKAATPIDIERLPEWVEPALEEFYNDPNSPKRIKTIAKQILEKGELSSSGLVKSFKKWYENTKKSVEEIEVTDKVSDKVQRVDPETGRPPGGFEAPEKPVYKSDFQAQADFLADHGPIKNSKGNIIKNKMIAQVYLDELGIGGKLVKSGEGWRVRKSKAEKAAFEQKLKDEYEKQLKEEGLGEVELEQSLDLFDVINNERGEVKIDFKEFGVGIVKLLKNERGEIRLSSKEADKIRFFFQSGKYTSNDLAKALRARGVSEKQIKDIFHTSVQKMTEGKGESKWFKKGDDPNELLPRRKKAGGRFAPAISRAEAHAASTAKDIKGRWWNENWTVETGDKTFERIKDVNGETLVDSFYWEGKRSAADAAREFKQKQKLSKSLRNGLSGKEQRRIGVYALMKQAGGEAIAESMGYTEMPKLSIKEMDAYNILRSEFKEYYDRVNEAREASGETKFPAVDNYFTWINDMQWLKDEHGLGMLENWQTMQSKLHQKQNVPSFRFAKHRGGEEVPRKLELNPFTIYEKYSKSALDTIYKAEPLAKMNELLLDRYGMREAAPNLYNFLMEWRDTQTGKPHIFNIANPKTVKALRTLNNNVVMALLSGTVRSALIQPTALLGSFVELNHHILTGLVKSIEPGEWKRAYETSNTLITRSPDVAIYEAMEGTGKMLKTQRKIADTLLTPLTVLDQLSAVATWLGAEAKAKALGIEDPVKYADRIVDKTQASAAKTNRAPIQRHIMGQTVTGLQTFVINHWGWLTRDVMGIGKADQTNLQTVAKVMKFVAATALINAAYEDGLGLQSPVATPIREFQKIKDETDSDAKATLAAAKELLEYIPIYGGTIKYGTQFGGPLVNTAWDLVRAAEKGEIGWKEIGKLGGVPGTNQFSKSYRAYEREGTMMDIILGRYIEPLRGNQGRSGRSSRSARASR